MVGYTFELMSDKDAASFTANDLLTFSTNGSTAKNVMVSEVQTGFGGSATEVTYLGKSLTFPADALSEASGLNHIQFSDNSTIGIGTGDGDGITLASPSGINNAPSSVAFGLGGSDQLNGGSGNNYLYGGTDDTTSAQLNGGIATAGTGGDRITAGDGNNHIYGNALGIAQGSTDGNDTITAGAGSNYINGNAGNDAINVGAAGSTGNNRVLGGGGDDLITLTGHGSNAVNGNMGNDTINGSAATGTSTLRGGQGSDIIDAGHGNNTIYGDAGNDVLVAGTGMTTTTNGVTVAKLTIMNGGADNDRFDFSGTDAGYAGTASGPNNVHSGISIGGQTYYQTIADFHQGEDTIHLSFSGMSTGQTPSAQYTDIVKAQDGATFTSVSSAEVYAQSLLTTHTLSTGNGTGNTTAAGEVAAVDVNGSTYLFFNHVGGETGGANSIDSIIQLQGVSSSTLTQGGTGIHTFG